MEKIFLLLALIVSSLIGATQYVKVTDVNNLQSGDTIIWVSEADSMATGAFTSSAKKIDATAITDTCAITVLRAGQVVTWKQVQYVSSLVEGAQVLIGTAAKDYVLGLYDNSVAKSNIRGQEATYSQNRREVTASDLYAYTVHKDGEKFYFEGSDGKYLYMYNTNKNLSSNETLNNQAKWTVSIEDLYGEVTMKSVYSSSWQVFFNKTAESPLFCTYTSSPQTDANIAPIVFYSDKATDWVEYVPNPQLTILIDKDTVTDKIDWGQVVFDDSWGTETNPYEESKSLTFVTKDIDEDISLSLYQGNAFTLYNETVAAKGGKASIQFSVKEKGTYADTLYVQTADTLIKIYLTAQAVDVEEVLPKLTLSTHAIYLNPNLDNNLTADAQMTFSVENLTKNLYIKWEKGEIPSWQNQSFVIKAGNEAAELVFGGATNMGTATRENEDILMEVYAFQPDTFVSDLCFYTYKENSKEDLAFEQRVTITVVVDNEYKPIPTDLENSRCTMHNAKYIKNGRVVIEREGRWYSVLGVEE